MDITNYVDDLHGDIQKCLSERRSEGYIKDKIATAFRAAIIEASNDFRDNDPKLADRRLECLKLATEQISNYASKSYFDDVDYTGKILGTADRLLMYVENGGLKIGDKLMSVDEYFANRETIGDVSHETSKGE